MLNSLKVLIENYNREEKRYDFGKQEIIEISIDDLKNILNDFPIPNQEISIPPRIITENYLFLKLNKDTCVFEYNYSFSLFLTSSYSFKMHKWFKFQLQELNDIFNELNNSKKKKLIYNIAGFFDRVAWLLYPIFNLLYIFLTITIDFINESIDLNRFIFTLWFVFFSIYSISYGITKIKNLRKKYQKCKIEYSFQFYNSFETLDISEIYIVTGQIFLFMFNFYYKKDFSIIQLIFSILLFILVIKNIYDFYKEYNINKNLKSYYIKALLKKIQKEKNSNDKNYYLQLAVLLKNKPVYAIEKIPKFYSVLSILITLIPIILYSF